MTDWSTETPAPPAPVFELLPEEAAAEPFYFHRSTLRELNSCGPYIRRHRELFPPTEYPEGPPINSVTCRRHATDFEWGWASSNMLDWNGRDEVERIANSRAERYRALGPGRASTTARYAAAFGYVFATHPEYRSRHVVNSQASLGERLERVARDELREVENELQEADNQLAHWAERKARAAEQLPALREAVERVKVQAAERAAAAKERELATARQRVAQLERELRAAKGKAKKLITEVADQREAAAATEPAAESTAEPATEETAP